MKFFDTLVERLLYFTLLLFFILNLVIGGISLYLVKQGDRQRKDIAKQSDFIACVVLIPQANRTVDNINKCRK